MSDATINEISSLIDRKKNELKDARYLSSMYSDLVARLEAEIKALDTVAEILFIESVEESYV